MQHPQRFEGARTRRLELPVGLDHRAHRLGAGADRIDIVLGSLQLLPGRPLPGAEPADLLLDLQRGHPGERRITGKSERRGGETGAHPAQSPALHHAHPEVGRQQLQDRPAPLAGPERREQGGISGLDLGRDGQQGPGGLGGGDHGQTPGHRGRIAEGGGERLIAERQDVQAAARPIAEAGHVAEGRLELAGDLGGDLGGPGVDGQARRQPGEHDLAPVDDDLAKAAGRLAADKDRPALRRLIGRRQRPRQTVHHAGRLDR